MNKRKKIKTQLCRVLIELTIWRGHQFAKTEKVIKCQSNDWLRHNKVYNVACPWVNIEGHAMLKHTKLHKVKVTELTKYGSITTIQINKRNDM